ncbi:probable maleylacetoacetate isomerase 1 [Vanessa atalanta]|uniref:probable maleylacetoacetate isomerase 1 n=1 Tax=Vanessa atalanta TaxID=42275 RepID=UPI001FCD964F|nr:probable maleylacetoacetate isomerase 1 [Vanessa atalanta]
MARMATETRAILYGFWLSSCSWRVRAALHLKDISYVERSVDIVNKRSQLTDEYRVINPSQKVPALIIDGATIIESMAILQYLEDTRPKPSLMPRTPILRARMREICETVVSGIQPLQNVGLLGHFDSKDQYINFTKYWTERGLYTLEDLLQKSSGQFCIENQLSMADLCLVPQLYNAVTRHKLSLDKFPTISKVYETLLEEKTFSDTHPENIKQKDM